MGPAVPARSLHIIREERMRIENREDVSPVCPHCQAVLQSIWYRKLHGTLGRRYVYFCPHCRKVLGVSHRKGFWMG